ncbi:MAG: hypothetical protein M1827_002013 [Pycnora praestabilis]|nr:MAG: hypothetical protein M1827_002013 [Pycnora praestabilis]
MADRYLLKVSAGPSYDPSTHQSVSVNRPTPTHISNLYIEAHINVRIQKYRGLPQGSPATSPYFSHPLHKSDAYSIAFTFVPKENIKGNDLLFGNDFDHPIRDKLPPGFSTALKIAKWAVDPGMDGDVYADQPYLYSPALSSWNAFYVGDMTEKLSAVGDGHEKMVLEEGGAGEGLQLREEKGIPADAKLRMKHFLDEDKRKEFDFEKGRLYQADFFNPYLDFNDFALKLPGFHLSMIDRWDGQPLRYVLRNKETKQVYLVILLTLVLKEDVEKEGKAAVEAAAGKEEEEGKGKGGFQPGDDDVD